MQPGTRVGRFEILSLLGRGGMGEVYRARDTRLGRDVALKLLAPDITADRDAVHRFEQEARAASALNHPAIVTIFDAGEQEGNAFIVTELLAGQTLRERLTSGRLTVDDSLLFAGQVAAGLAAAHGAGIVHRDVKPENIFLARNGQVKILDFGVARLVPRPFSTKPDAGATTAVLPTLAGTLIGTPGYMAPEQARGEAVDTRADIFALGCVIYEMLSGARAFAKPTAFETIAAVIAEQPPSLQEAPAVPSPLIRVIERAMEKDPTSRFQSMDDFAFALKNSRGGTTTAGHQPPRTRLNGWPVIALAGIGAAALLTRAMLKETTNESAFALRASVVVPASAVPISPALSPDGKWVAYIGLAGADPDVFVQFLNGGVPVNLTRPHNVPVQRRTIVGRLDIAPDGNSILVPGPWQPGGQFRLSGLWSVPAPLGGPPRRVGERAGGIAISSDGKRFAMIQADPLLGDAVAVANTDGSAEKVLVPAAGGLHFHQVAWSRDDRYIYYVRTAMANHTQGDIYRVPASGGTPEPVVQTPGTAMYPAPTPDGAAIIYAGNRRGEGFNLWWHPLDGSPEQRLTIGTGEYTEPFVSRNGTALVCTARRRRAGLVRVAADTTDGTPELMPAGNAGDTQPSLGLDGGRIFVSSSRSGERRIWSLDTSRGTAVPLTGGNTSDDRPAVSADGRRV
ncbi:MAG: protein kinase, partial [Vicinamibacterales bacterium]